MASAIIETPFGPARLSEENEKLVSLEWSMNDETDEDEVTPVLAEAQDQLRAYFQGELRNIDVPIAPGGIGIQSMLAPIIRDIPYGGTITYQRLAIAAYHSPVNQIVSAVVNNPLPVIVPCHRVIGEDRLGRYVGRGGAGTKMALLRLENPSFNPAGLRLD